MERRSGTKRRILVIEDDDDLRRLQKASLSADGYDVIEAATAREGLETAFRERPDVILMDVRLPYKSKGIGTAKLIRKNPDTARTPIIFVSAYAEWSESNEIKTIERSLYMVKPVEHKELIDAIEGFFTQTNDEREV